MTKPPVVIPMPDNAPGVLHVDTGQGKFGPTPTHDIGHEVTHTNERADTVRQLAYALWEARGRPHGSSDVDWLAAEREVLGRNHSPDQRVGTQVDKGLGLMKDAGQGPMEDGLTNPHDGRGPLRPSDDQGYEKGPLPTAPQS